MQTYTNLRIITTGFILCFTPLLLSASGEEFVGPFASWRDLRQDCGAVGDGKADDTMALQRALDELIKHESACVLYIPAGTYRLTATVQTKRKEHTDCQGVAIVGEDPSSTILLWDGPAGGTMFQWDAWYSKISRLTFDGRGQAGTGLLYGPSFSTYNETSDLVFRDIKNGLVFGGEKTNGQAENEVLRCRFVNCETGVQTVNWNSMDIWVWYCRFEDCGRGIFNVMGNWHAWENLFLRSRIADVGIINLMAFSVVNNTSIKSNRFLDFETGHTWGSPTSITGNRVLDPTGDFAMKLSNAGPYLVVDNIFRCQGKKRAVQMTWADQTFVGNTYTDIDAVAERGRFRRIAEKTVDAKLIPDALPELPPTPPQRKRRVFEVNAGAGSSQIQQAINEASKLAGRQPVVHLPMGNYILDQTLVIPAGWENGSVKGLRARGGFEVDIQWQDGTLQAAEIRSRNGGRCNARYGEKTTTLSVEPQEAVRLKADLTVWTKPSARRADTTQTSSAVLARDYHFDGNISREVLENYLDRSVTMAYFLVTGKVEGGREYLYREDDLRLIRNIGAKFIGRAIYRWNGENRLNDPSFWADAKALIDRVHAFDPDVIFQGCLFETISRSVDSVKIPSWVFTEFGLPAEDRTFSYDAMLNKDGKLVNHWGRSSVPDVTRLETQLWF